MPTDRPFMKWFPRDWLGDPAVRAVSSQARGLWIDMLCLMYESPKTGHLEHANGSPVSQEQLAKMTGNTIDEVRTWLSELETCGVFSRNGGGSIYSRRMVRDDNVYRAAVAFGKTGGNPSLKPKDGGGVNPPLNPNAKGGDRASAHVSEVRSQNADSEDRHQNAKTENTTAPTCASAPSEPKPPKMRLNLETWKWENVTAQDRSLWLAAYPACDIDTELAKMVTWCKSNGAKGHKSNWSKFVTNWLSRCQDRGGSAKSNNTRSLDFNAALDRIKSKASAGQS